jgi:hypothetical protein
VVERNAEEGVTWISSFVSEDKTRTFCVYDVPTPEAIRKAAIGNELPVDEITQVRVLDPYFYAWARRHTKEDIMFTFSKLAPTPAVTTTRRPAGKSGTLAQVRRPHLPDTTGSPAPAFADEHHDLAGRGAHAGDARPWDSRSAGTGMGSGPGWLSFQRIVDIPFGACVAAFESWQREGRGGGLQVGHSRLRGPVEHDRGSGACRVEVRLARGLLRPLLRMRLDVDCWSSSSRTAFELIPCGRVRATASYFRAGHLLLDSLTHSLQLEPEIQALDRATR